MRDSIETSIDINATRERVWGLVSEPGWWINNGALGGDRIERCGDECLVTDPELGAFAVGVLALEPLERAVFTWHPGGDDVPRTTVEFVLFDAAPGVVTVRVTETGFAAMSPEAHARNYGANVEGWGEELGLARTAAEGAPGAR
ncbi:ATPase [Galactobacter valiniphilus]|uniref:ATPase n=1 Tax=Galactobacter valiniphilus TaxID=2676122 RepID=A0A399JBX1_9MICC|nr:SRPBCC domain-containing protein [Galactobacter valiniphilus]RII43065.1 ATPase [Galactobacter valiniphilus]